MKYYISIARDEGFDIKTRAVNGCVLMPLALQILNAGLNGSKLIGEDTDMIIPDGLGYGTAMSVIICETVKLSYDTHTNRQHKQRLVLLEGKYKNITTPPSLTALKDTETRSMVFNVFRIACNGVILLAQNKIISPIVGAFIFGVRNLSFLCGCALKKNKS
jgi:hypothetical protein